MRNKKYYIAYGSNLSVEQMAYRCPDAKIEGQAVLAGWELLFRGCATIAPNPKKNTPVLMWEISERDEEKADSLAGELVRAMSRIGYRFHNDGDMVNIAYGKETCNPAARFLIAKGNAEVSSLTAGLWEIFSEEAYEKVLDILCGAVADYVEQNPDLRNQPTEDMWDLKDEEEDQDDSWDEEEDDWDEEDYDEEDYDEEEDY